LVAAVLAVALLFSVFLCALCVSVVKRFLAAN
jgi:hypothetical protein